jgi:hypothetical protein
MFITDWIRAAVAGVTADGRNIDDQQLVEMASSYSQDTYNARIWAEHIRSVTPDGMFKALGDVLNVKAERIKGGDLNGRMALYVRIEPHQDLIAMVRNGQKVHLSIEAQPNFANTGKYYLVGLGVTDSPASLGTGIMKFSTAARQENLFSTPQETLINLPQANGMTTEEYKTARAEFFKAENAALAEMLAQQKKELSELFEAKVAELKQVAKENHDALIEFATPPNGNPHQDRKPHGGGYSDSEKRYGY